MGAKTGAATLSITTLSTLSSFVTLSINDTQHNNTSIMLSVVMLSVVMLNVVAPKDTQ